jgi:hypothetical protein
MKHLKHINEENLKVGRPKPRPHRVFNNEEDRYEFDPAEHGAKVTFYLHEGKNGFSMDIALEDRDMLDDILNNNNISHTITIGNELPF